MRKACGLQRRRREPQEKGNACARSRRTAEEQPLPGPRHRGGQGYGVLFHHGSLGQQPQPHLRPSNPTASAPRPTIPRFWKTRASSSTTRYADGPGPHRHQRGPDGHHPGVFKAGPSHGAGPPHAGIRAGRSQLDPADFRAAGAQRQLQAVHPESRRRDRQTLPAADLEYPGQPGTGHFLHTYAGDGDPLPSFAGEPEQVAVEGDIDSLASAVWDALDEANRISLFVRFTDLETRDFQQRIVNKYSGKETQA